MIVRPMGQEGRLITQHDHARAAGTLARRWAGAAAIPPPPPELCEPVYYAVDNHDVGWCRPDASPRLDPETKLPFSFFGVTAEEATQIWREGIVFCAAYRPFAGCLVSVHFSALANAGLRGAPSDELVCLRRFVQNEREHQKALARHFSPEEEAAKEKAALLLRTCDTLSLLACGAPEITPAEGRIQPLAQSGLRIRPVAGDGLEVAPWPFDVERLELRFPGLTIPCALFESEEDLKEALTWAEPSVYVSLLTPLRD